jgi:hypothetical protein
MIVSFRCAGPATDATVGGHPPFYKLPREDSRPDRRTRRFGTPRSLPAGVGLRETLTHGEAPPSGRRRSSVARRRKKRAPKPIPQSSNALATLSSSSASPSPARLPARLSYSSTGAFATSLALRSVPQSNHMSSGTSNTCQRPSKFRTGNGGGRLSFDGIRLLLSKLRNPKRRVARKRSRAHEDPNSPAHDHPPMVALAVSLHGPFSPRVLTQRSM